MVVVPRPLIFLPLFLLAACSPEKPAAQRPVPEVSVLAVTTKTIPYSATFVAQTESSRQVDIVARVAGFLDRIAYAEGDIVKDGQVLFQIDPKPFKAQLESAQGELGAQKARLNTATATYRRVKPLADQNALSQADLDKATGELEAANAAVFSAGAKVREAELNLGYTTVRSPVNGVAGRALQREGAYVGAAVENAKLTYVAVLDPIWVTFSVSQNQLAQMREMTEKKLLTVPDNNQFDVELSLPGDKVYPYHGKINFADPSFSEDTGSFMVRASLPNPKKELRPGMFVSAKLLGATRPNAVVVPQLAVQQGAKGHFVLLANAQDKVEIRPITLGGYVNDKEIAVDQGLQAGERLIVDGFTRLAPDMPVKPVPAEQAKEATAPAAAPSAAPAAEKK